MITTVAWAGLAQGEFSVKFLVGISGEFLIPATNRCFKIQRAGFFIGGLWFSSLRLSGLGLVVFQMLDMVSCFDKQTFDIQASLASTRRSEFDQGVFQD